MKNKIFVISLEEVLPLKEKLDSEKSMHIAEVNGEAVHSWKDYSIEIEKAFRFPTSCVDSVDRFLDWIRDLDWLNKNGYTLIIYNFKDFLKSDLKLKEEVINYFKDVIFPFWEAEVEYCVVEGKSKPFNVYLVD